MGILEDSCDSGAAKYVLDDELAKVVNVSMALEMPLLLKGERERARLCSPRNRESSRCR